MIEILIFDFFELDHCDGVICVLGRWRGATCGVRGVRALIDWYCDIKLEAWA